MSLSIGRRRPKCDVSGKMWLVLTRGTAIGPSEGSDAAARVASGLAHPIDELTGCSVLKHL